MPQPPVPPKDSPSPNRKLPYLETIQLSSSAVDDAKATDPKHWQPHSEQRRKRLSESQVLILGFAAMILAGALLLRLPWASASGQPITWSEAIFTSTSAVTVTGLAVRNTATDFSIFGQIIILLLLQVGGVGFIAFSVLLFRLIGRRITLQTRFIVQQSVGASGLAGALNLAMYVLGVTLLFESAGAALLWLRWRQTLPNGTAAWYAVFHAISSYCNAGFDLFSGTDHSTLFGYGSDWYSLIVMGTLIVLGGFGITIMYDLWGYRSDRSLGLNTRLSLWVALFLTVAGAVMLLFDESFHRVFLPEYPHNERVAVGLFTIVSARTAGITILPLTQLSEATQMIILIWMFIGGAPASMAGGVSTSTFAVMLVAVMATARGHTSAVAFRRTLPAETIAKAVAIMTVSVLLVVMTTLFLVLNREGPIFATGFEVVSAFSNTGYSLDFTSSLDTLGRYVIAFTMFWGRLGPLTIVVALAQREHPTLVGYPEEPVILG